MLQRRRVFPIHRFFWVYMEEYVHSLGGGQASGEAGYRATYASLLSPCLSRAQTMRNAISAFLRRHGLGVLAVVLAMALTPPFAPPVKPFVFLVAVAVTTWYGGRKQGFLAAALSALVIRFFLLHPIFSLSLNALLIMRLGAFLLVCLVLVEFAAARRQAELSWHKAEKWNRLFAETSHEGIWVFDSSGRTTFVNNRMAEILGYSTTELLGQPVEDFLVDNPRALDLPGSDRTKPDSVRQQTLRLRRSDGSKIMAVVSANPVLGDDGEIFGLLALVDDVTAHKRTEQERDRALKVLEACEAQHGRLVASNIIGIITAGLAGEVIEANDAFLQMVGYSREDLSRGLVRWLDLTQIENDPLDQRSIKELWEHGACTPYEKEFIRKDGERVSVLIGKAALERYPRTWIGFVLDLTERKRAERALKQAKDAAEAASRAKDQFLAVLSHELRTPLTPVLAMATAVLDNPTTPAELRPMIEMTRRNIELEARLIDDLLDVTRIARGKLQLDLQVVDAHSLILQALEICRDEIVAGHLRLETDLSASDHHVLGDPARLQQIFWNLIKNAVKFSPPGERLMVCSRNIAAAGGPESRLIVEVADTGIGIETDVLPKIFNAFEQGDDSVAQQFGGLGLGLAISRSVAEMHGGRLSAASPGRGQGATFTLDLATVPSPTPEEKDLRPILPAAPPSTLRILLVEDNADTLQVLARLLRRHGYRVTTACSVSSALEASLAGEYDVVVSDIGLPDGSGLDVIREMRAHSAVKGIALSGYGMEEDRRTSQEAGFVAHLTKPVDFVKLEAMIQQVAATHEQDEVAIGPG